MSLLSASYTICVSDKCVITLCSKLSERTTSVRRAYDERPFSWKIVGAPPGVSFRWLY